MTRSFIHSYFRFLPDHYHHTERNRLMNAKPANSLQVLHSNRRHLALSLVGLIIAFGLQSCSDTVLNPEQVVPVTGFVYRGNSVYKDDIPVVDSASNVPVRIVFVRLGEAAGGSGTFESPFSSITAGLEVAQAGDIVLVFRGSDPGISNFRIPDGVRVFSDHPFQKISTRNFGMMVLPYTGTEPPTQVIGTAEMGNNTEIAGFQFLSLHGSGVHGTEVSNVIIRNNLFTNTFRQGIHLLNVAGTIVVHDNQVFVTRDSTSPGIYVENTHVTTNAWLYRNSITDPASDGIKIFTHGHGITEATVDSNTIVNTIGSSIKFFSTEDAYLSAYVSNNVMSRNAGTVAQDGAIRCGTFDRIRGKITVINNRIFNCGTNGIFVGSENVADMEVTVLNNDVTECVGNGIFVGAQHNSHQSAVIANNVSTRNKVNPDVTGFPTGHGIFFGTLNFGREEGTLSFNRVYENEKTGLFCPCFNAGKLVATLTDNLISNNGANGIEMSCGLNVPPVGPDQVPPPLPPVGANQGNFRVLNNVIAGNKGGGAIGQEGGGIMYLVFNGAVMESVAQNNHINNNGTASGAYAGLGLLVFNQAAANVSFRYNTFSLNPASPAVNIRTFGAIPPAQPVPGVSSQICLELVGNVSDTGFLLTKDKDTKFALLMDQNQGPMMIPNPLDSNPECHPPKFTADASRF